MAEESPNNVIVPSPTAWPIVLAFGISAIFAGLVTTAAVSILGACVAIVGAVRWFREVLPHESEVALPVLAPPPAISTAHPEVRRLAELSHVPRPALPIEVWPVSSGIKGGLAGSVVMAGLAMLYGVFSGRGIWYPVNLLAAGFFPGAATKTAAQIATFKMHDLLAAVMLHLLVSILVGLLYGALLPMLPRHPIVLGGLVAPLAWSCLIFGILGFVNPVLNMDIDWLWFVLSQIGFGITAGLVVSCQHRVATPQRVPLLIRAGIKTPSVQDFEKGPQE